MCSYINRQYVEYVRASRLNPKSTIENFEINVSRKINTHELTYKRFPDFAIVRSDSATDIDIVI